MQRPIKSSDFLITNNVSVVPLWGILNTPLVSVEETEIVFDDEVGISNVTWPTKPS